MNLVQINERLKDLPMQVLQQYANGMNPEVPPYLALGELQRREMSQKQMATAQGAQQGPQPSVKEQVEQKAGLMALQQMQQQQVAQQMQQPRGPMPAPAGVPQPEPQPEAMLARGGLAGVPMRRDMFEYAGGGIIAFAGGGSVEDKYQQESQEMVSGDRVQYSPEVAKYAEQLRAKQSAARQTEEREYLAKEQQRMLRGPNAPAPTANPNVTDDTMKRVGPMTAPKFADPRTAKPEGVGASGLPAALAKTTPAGQTPPATDGAKPSAAPRPTGLPAALPGQATPQPSVSPFLAEAATMARDKPVAPTAEGIKTDINALMPEGMQEAAQKKLFADQRARADERKATFEKTRPSGLDDLIRVFGQAGQYKGMSGLAPAETALQQQRRAEELGFQKEQNELLTAIEGRSAAADKGVFEARTGAMDKANKSFQDRLVANTKALADLAGVDQRRIDEAAQRLTQMEVEKLRSATQNRSLNEKLKFEADYLSLKSQARDLTEKGDTAGAAKIEAKANDMLSIRAGGGGAAAVGAGRNAIMDRRQTMTELEKIIKDEGMMYSDAEKKQAANEYKRLAMMNATEGSGGGGAFTVTAGGKTYTFPTQEAANKFKAEAGVK